MKKNIIAMAVAAAVAAPAAAIADTTLYGKISVSTDFYGGDNAKSNNYTISSNSSRIGIRGTEDIANNLALVYQWEAEMGWGDDSSANGGFGGQRNTFIGFTGDWGTAIAGRHDTPFKLISRKYDLFGDTIGDSRSILRGRNFDADWEKRTPNTIAYITPNMSGFQAKAAYVSDWSGGTDNDQDAWSLSAGYGIAGFSIDAAYEQVNVGSDDLEAWRLGAGYEFDGFKVVALYQDTEMDFNGNSREAWGLGGSYTFGNNTVKAQWYTADSIDNTSSTGADMWAIGYDYKLSKQTSVYAMFAHMSNESNVCSYTLGGGTGHGKSAPIDGTTGADISSVSFGVSHSF